MPRTTPPGLTNLLPGCETQSTVDITLRDGTTKYFCTGETELLLGGNLYERLLKRVGDLQETLGQATNRVEVKVSNVDGEFGQNVASPERKMELADVVIRRLYRNLNDGDDFHWMHFFTGKAVNSVVTEQFVTFDVIPDTTAAGTCIATETMSPNNGWKFPETPEQSPPGSGENPHLPPWWIDPDL
jgi:hypothetical protein